MVFPLQSVSGPGSKQLLNDGTEPISNRLKTQQAIAAPPPAEGGRKAVGHPAVAREGGGGNSIRRQAL